jgi:hypothetical protein
VISAPAGAAWWAWCKHPINLVIPGQGEKPNPRPVITIL